MPPSLKESKDMTRKSRLSRCMLANYRYEKDKAVGTYVQDLDPVLAQAHEDRENNSGAFDKRDLDMGYKMASVPMVWWLEIQKLGIDNDIVAIHKFLQIKKEKEGKDVFCTKKRLI